MSPEQLVQSIKELIRPLLESRQTELVEFTCRQAGRRLILRCLVDTARGITVQELSELNRAIGAVLDEHDAVPESYLLEVSSPGLDRPLKRWTDFERVIGRRVKVITHVSVDFRFEHVGKLLSASEEAIVLSLDSGDKVQIRLPEIASAVQDIQF